MPASVQDMEKGSRTSSTDSLLEAVFGNSRRLLVGNRWCNDESTARAGSGEVEESFRRELWTTEARSLHDAGVLNSGSLVDSCASTNGTIGQMLSQPRPQSFNRLWTADALEQRLTANMGSESDSCASAISQCNMSSFGCDTSSNSSNTQQRFFVRSPTQAASMQLTGILPDCQMNVPRNDQQLPLPLPQRLNEQLVPSPAASPAPFVAQNAYAGFLPLSNPAYDGSFKCTPSRPSFGKAPNDTNNSSLPRESMAAVRGTASEAQLSNVNRNGSCRTAIQREISKEQLAANLRMLKAKELNNVMSQSQSRYLSAAASANGYAHAASMPQDRTVLPRSVQNGVFVLNGQVMTRDELANLLGNIELERSASFAGREQLAAAPLPQPTTPQAQPLVANLMAETEATRNAIANLLLNSQAALLNNSFGRPVVGMQRDLLNCSELELQMLAARLATQLDQRPSVQTPPANRVQSTAELPKQSPVITLGNSLAIAAASRTSNNGHANSNGKSRASRTSVACKFCENNGEPVELYSTHTVKDGNGRVTCPVLRAYICPLCNASGDQAHTLKYCPLSTGGDHVDTHKLLKLGRNAAGKKRRDSNSNSK